jgi:hypothetical protein
MVRCGGVGEDEIDEDGVDEEVVVEPEGGEKGGNAWWRGVPNHQRRMRMAWNGVRWKVRGEGMARSHEPAPRALVERRVEMNWGDPVRRRLLKEALLRRLEIWFCEVELGRRFNEVVCE